MLVSVVFRSEIGDELCQFGKWQRQKIEIPTVKRQNIEIAIRYRFRPKVVVRAQILFRETKLKGELEIPCGSVGSSRI